MTQPFLWAACSTLVLSVNNYFLISNQSKPLLVQLEAHFLLSSCLLPGRRGWLSLHYILSGNCREWASLSHFFSRLSPLSSLTNLLKSLGMLLPLICTSIFWESPVSTVRSLALLKPELHLPHPQLNSSRKSCQGVQRDTDTVIAWAPLQPHRLGPGQVLQKSTSFGISW